MTMAFSLLSATQARALAENFVAVYRDAFAAAPYHKQEVEVAEFATSLPQHTGEDGFRCVVARITEDDVAGFAYGRRCQPGSFWFETVYPCLQAARKAYWLEDAFQVVEMAVHPHWQGRGIGGGLHDRLLAQIPYRRALLTTMAAETPAARLYRRRGWTLLAAPFAVPGLPRRYQILGRVLPLTLGSRPPT
jgi:GNAT superfamily N-acetyltransferase